VPAVAFVVALATALVGLQVDRFDARHPIPSQLVYALDTDTGRASWATTEADPVAYTAQYVDEKKQLDEPYPYVGCTEIWTGEAQPAQLPAPAVQTVSDRPSGDRREVTVRVTPQRPGARLLVMQLDDGD